MSGVLKLGSTTFGTENNGKIELTNVGPTQFSSSNYTWELKAVDAPIVGANYSTNDDPLSGQLAIYNGATKLWGITEGGLVQNPNVPSFFAWNDNNQDSVSGSAGTKFIFKNTLFNNGGHYDTTTYTFTAPINGLYKFTSSGLYRQSGQNASGEMTFYKNGTNVVNRGLAYSYFGTTDTDYHDQQTIECLLNLSAGDYVYTAIYDCPSGTNFYINGGLGWFSGYLIG